MQNALSKGEQVIPQPGILQLSSANIDRHGAYLLDAGTHLYLWLGAALSDRFCMEVFDRPNFQALPEVSVSAHWLTIANINLSHNLALLIKITFFDIGGL